MFGYKFISKILIGIFLIFGAFWSNNPTFGQYNTLKNNAFIQSILTKNYSIKHIHTGHEFLFLDSISLKKDQILELIKTKKSSFIVSRGSGFVFKQYDLLDSTVRFSKIDSTHYDGYNFDDIKFNYNDTLFSIGGFGFWRNNGQVRYFTENKEWELLFPELALGMSNRNYWNFDSKKGLLYLIVNIKNDKQSLLTINLREKSWEFEEIPYTFLSTLLSKNEYPIQIQLNNDNGSILCFSNEIYYLDLSKKILKKANNNKLLNFFNKNKIRESSAYHDGKFIYTYFNEEKLLDSIDLNLSSFTLINSKDFKSTFNKNIALILTSILLVFIVLFLVYKKKRKKNKLELNDFELDFLKKLLIKEGKQIDIESLNYLLGLSKKSLEIQKKNRSEFLNKLNQKIKEVLYTDENVIIRVKDEDDKRVFVYQLNPIFFTQVQELI